MSILLDAVNRTLSEIATAPSFSSRTLSYGINLHISMKEHGVYVSICWAPYGRPIPIKSATDMLAPEDRTHSARKDKACALALSLISHVSPFLKQKAESPFSDIADDARANLLTWDILYENMVEEDQQKVA